MTPTIINGAYELVPIESVKNHPKNARRGNLTAIRESIRENGFYGSLVVQKGTGFVLIGNHRLRAGREEGLTEVPVVWVEVDDARATKIALADNRTSDLATYDHRELVDVLGGLDSLVGTAFDPKDLAKLVRTEFVPSSEDDPVPSAPEAECIVKAGEVWELGDHVLGCCDSFSPAAASVLEGRKFDAVIMDPPFAIYGSSTGVGTDVADDKMVRPFFERMFRTTSGLLKTHGHAYVFCDWRSWPALWDACGCARGANKGGLAPRNLLVWDKGAQGMGSMYQSCHELVGFFVAEAPARAMKGNKKGGARPVHGRSNVIRYNRVQGADRLHNAAKPIGMIEEFLGNSTDKNETVVDLFGGSGSTLIACERLERRCTMLEIEPAWCDVIIRRWQVATGKSARRVG